MRKDNAALVGAGAVACAACCAGPILSVLTAIGLGTAVGVALWGLGALVVGLLVLAVLVRRRRVVAAPTPMTEAAVGVPGPKRDQR